MQLDDKALNFIKNAKAAGATIDQVASFLRDKGYEFDYTPSTQEQPQQEQQVEQEPSMQQEVGYQSPGLIKGSARKFSTEATAGLAPILAGATNVGARQWGGIIAAIADRNPEMLKELDPRKMPQFFKEGKEEYIQTQKKFAEEHPIANTIAGATGTLAGLALTGGTAGATAKGVVATTKLGQAGKAGAIISRTAGEMAGFGTYEAIREGFDSGELDAKAALGGLGKGAGLGLAFGVMGGGMQAFEPQLVKQAERLIGNPTASKILVNALGIGVEGTTVGAVPAVMEGQTPTAKDIGVGVGMVAGGRGLAKAGSWIGGKAYKFANEPTKMQAEEMRARVAEVEGAQQKADTALAEEIAATRERRALSQQGASKEVVKEAKATEDWYAAERQKAEGELARTLEGQDLAERNVQVSATDEEVQAWLKQNAKNPNITESKARRAVEREKLDAANRMSATQKLPLKERIARSLKSTISKVGRQFNWARPVEEGVFAYEATTGKKVAPSQNPYFTINKLQGGGEQEALLKPVYDTMVNVEKKYPGSVEGAREYLEADKRIQFLRDTDSVPTSELTDVIADYKDDKPVQEIVKAVRSINQKALDRLYEVGRIDKQTYDLWKKNDAYVPSRAEMYDEVGEQIVSNNFESAFKKYKGGADSYQNPIVSSMEQVKRIDQFAELQKAKRQYIDLAKQTGQATKSKTIEDYKGGQIKFDKANQIVLWKDGNPEIWNVPKNVADYFNPAPIPKDDKPMKFLKAALAMPLRTFKGATTAASLGFAESNIPRDLSGALFGSEYGGFLSASMQGSSAKEIINGEPIVGALRKQMGAQTLRNVEQLPGLAENNVQRAVDMFEALDKATKPGTQSNVISKMFSIALPDYLRKSLKFGRGAKDTALEALSYAGNLSEETTRLSVFKSVLQGMAKNEAEYERWLRNPDLIPADVMAKAGNEAREVTLNFRRQMAPWVEMSNRYFAPYFKPAILGAMRGMEMLSNPAIAPRAWRYIINLGIMQGLIKGRIAQGKQLEDLDAINNEIAGKTLILRGKKDRLYTIPLGQELAPFVNMFAGVTEKIYRNGTKQQREDITREMLTSGRQMIENYAPVYGYLATPSNFALGGPIPKTILEEWTNKDFYTRTPIVPDSQKNRPEYMQQTKSTPALAIQLSKTLARRGINISPLRIRHISNSLFSNVSKEMFAASDAVLREFGVGPLRPEKGVTDSPYTRRLIADITAPYNQYSQDANVIIEEARKGHKAIEEGNEEDWSDKQRRRYEMQDDIYFTIEGDMNSLKEIYRKRATEEKSFAEDSAYLREEYKNKKISKQQYLEERKLLEREFKQFEEEQAQEERILHLAIIQAERDVKESYKKAPK